MTPTMPTPSAIWIKNSLKISPFSIKLLSYFTKFVRKLIPQEELKCPTTITFGLKFYRAATLYRDMQWKLGARR